MRWAVRTPARARVEGDRAPCSPDRAAPRADLSLGWGGWGGVGTREIGAGSFPWKFPAHGPGRLQTATGRRPGGAQLGSLGIFGRNSSSRPEPDRRAASLWSEASGSLLTLDCRQPVSPAAC